MENKPIKEFTRTLNIEGKSLRAELKVYSDPVKSTNSAKIFTRLEIWDGDTEWGNCNWPSVLEDEREANKVFDDIINRPHIYKNKVQSKPHSNEIN